jgi:hypothetical protein
MIMDKRALRDWLRSATMLCAVVNLISGADCLSHAQDDADQERRRPLTEMTAQDRYKGQDGGLYGGGRNEPPAELREAAEAELAQIQPLDAEGRPSAEGRIALVSISMSNATQEFSRFKRLADDDPARSPQLTIVDCAQGGQAMAEWASPDAAPWLEAERRIARANVSMKQVQVAWIKLANKGPRGTLEQHGRKLQHDTQAVLQIARTRFPNLRIAYLSSRIFGGYATNRLNPEPYAYESAFAARWLIQDQVAGQAGLNWDPARGPVKAPLLLWGPYLWADGATPRAADGLRYLREDLAADGTHPSESGRDKVAQLLLKFFRDDPLTRPWFTGQRQARSAPRKGQQPPEHPLNVWVKRTPRDQAPVSPRLGYEGACVWDSQAQLLVRFGGHNQGGGGEQGAEVWTFDPQTDAWSLREPNTSPPGVCCNAQNVYMPTIARYVRFPFFSGSHGWQWARELYLNDSSVWTYDSSSNRWRNLRPLPAPRLAPYRCASWDSDEQRVVVFGGEGSHEGTLIYDPARNEWTWPRPDAEPAPRSGGNMAYDAKHKLHILFGSQFDNDPHTWAYDLPRNKWRDMQPALQPPTDRNDAVLTYDPIHEVVIALIKVSTGSDDDAVHELQTWSYDAGANRWTRMHPAREPEPSGNRARNLLFASEWNLAILENCTSKPREQQIWTYRIDPTSLGQSSPPSPSERSDALRRHDSSGAVATRAPLLVEDAVVSVVSAERVELAWSAPVTTEPVLGYIIERAEVEVWSDDQLRRLKARTPPRAEPTVGALRRIGQFHRLNQRPIAEASYVDSSVRLNVQHPPQSVGADSPPSWEQKLHDEHLDVQGREYPRAVYAYRVRCVDGAGRESGPSPAWLTIPSSPQNVFSREAGTTCELQWSANPERGIAGYRIYRMDGRYDKDPVSRLTPDPIDATQFADETAGKNSRRYYVVAVDALGQEGLPSSPVWCQREWRDYYRPFVSEWHQ